MVCFVVTPVLYAQDYVRQKCMGHESCTLDPIHVLGDTCPNKHKVCASFACLLGSLLEG